MKSVILIVLFVYVGIGLYLYVQQRSLIYLPPPLTPSVLPFKKFVNEGVEINVSVLNEHNKKAIIYFGGNAENVDYNAESFIELFPDHAIYLVKYRGYGGSAGKPTEQGLYSDALYIYDELSSGHKEISIIGRSLGSAVATYLAANRQTSKLVLITPFDSIQSVAQSLYPIYPMSVLLKDKHDSYSRVSIITAKTLVIAAEHDQAIGMSHTQRLVDEFSNEVLFEVIEGADHNNISNFPHYNKIISGFL